MAVTESYGRLIRCLLSSCVPHRIANPGSATAVAARYSAWLGAFIKPLQIGMELKVSAEWLVEPLVNDTNKLFQGGNVIAA